MPADDPALEVLNVDFNLAEEMIEYDHLKKWLDQLSHTSRLAFVLHTLEGYNHREVSEKLQISEGSSRWHVSTAKKELMKKIKAFTQNLKTIVL